MSLTVSYNLRHLIARRTSTLLTLFGITLVVFVYVVSLMLAQGLRKTLAATGSIDNVIVLRNGAQNEIQSGINKEHANIILADEAVARMNEGQALATTDSVVLVSLKRRVDGEPSNVNLRGVSRQVFNVRRGISLVSGRRPEPGSKEVMVGRAIHERFAKMEIGSAVRLMGTDWSIVGVFDAGTSAFNSEIWGDVDILLPASRRDRFSTVTFRLKEGSDFEALRERLENDRRLTVSVKREKIFYEDLSRSLAKFISILGTFVSLIFAVGAVIGAMITMYSAVANRTREIGILRALGFSQTTIFLSFLKECLLIGFIGGVIAVAAGSLMSFVSFSTTNFTTFSDVAFGFAITPGVVLNGITFSLIMGLLGGALPALRAGRLGILTALRSE